MHRGTLRESHVSHHMNSNQKLVDRNETTKQRQHDLLGVKFSFHWLELETETWLTLYLVASEVQNFGYWKETPWVTIDSTCLRPTVEIPEDPSIQFLTAHSIPKISETLRNFLQFVGWRCTKRTLMAVKRVFCRVIFFPDEKMIFALSVSSIYFLCRLSLRVWITSILIDDSETYLKAFVITFICQSLFNSNHLLDGDAVSCPPVSSLAFTLEVRPSGLSPTAAHVHL